MTPFDFINSINEKKKYLFENCNADDSGEAADLDALDKKYLPFMVNRGLSNFTDTILFANEMNSRAHMSKKMQYDFLFHSVRRKKRFSKWHKKEKDSKDIELIKEAYNCNRERAEEFYDLLDMDKLRVYMSKGGIL
tara:strand:+ start:6116 stop:6523 length:408 start_codon:yes stop_codon:yes gene_type:complete